MSSYKVLIGIDYPPNKRAEAGDVVSDLPTSAVKWLVEGNYVELVEQQTKKKNVTDSEE